MSDPEAPEADAREQAMPVTPDETRLARSEDPEAPEADALDQAAALPIDDDERPAG